MCKKIKQIVTGDEKWVIYNNMKCKIFGQVKWGIINDTIG